VNYNYTTLLWYVCGSKKYFVTKCTSITLSFALSPYLRSAHFVEATALMEKNTALLYPFAVLAFHFSLFFSLHLIIVFFRRLLLFFLLFFVAVLAFFFLVAIIFYFLVMTLLLIAVLAAFFSLLFVVFALVTYFLVFALVT